MEEDSDDSTSSSSEPTFDDNTVAGLEVPDIEPGQRGYWAVDTGFKLITLCKNLPNNT
jgi:hypothetical protein